MLSTNPSRFSHESVERTVVVSWKRHPDCSIDDDSKSVKEVMTFMESNLSNWSRKNAVCLPVLDESASAGLERQVGP